MKQATIIVSEQPDPKYMPKVGDVVNFFPSSDLYEVRNSALLPNGALHVRLGNFWTDVMNVRLVYRRGHPANVTACPQGAEIYFAGQWTPQHVERARAKAEQKPAPQPKVTVYGPRPHVPRGKYSFEGTFDDFVFACDWDNDGGAWRVVNIGDIWHSWVRTQRGCKHTGAYRSKSSAFTALRNAGALAKHKRRSAKPNPQPNKPTRARA